MPTKEKLIALLSDGNRHSVSECATVAGVKRETILKHIDSLVISSRNYLFENGWVRTASVHERMSSAYTRELIEKSKKALVDYPEHHVERLKIEKFIQSLEAQNA